MKIKKVMSLALAFMMTLALLGNQVAYADSGDAAAHADEAEEAAVITAAATTAAETSAEVIITTEPSEDESSSEEASLEEVPSEEASSEEAPSEEASSEEAPSEETPSEETPSEETPSEEAPSTELPNITGPTPGVGADTTDEGGGMMPSPEPNPDIGSVIPVQTEADAPYLAVMPVKTIAKGSSFDPMMGTYAFDEIEGDVTSRIVVESNNVDVNTVNISDSWTGTPYEVVYSVTNSRGRTSRVTAQVYVYDASRIGALSVSTSGFTVVQGENLLAKIRDNIVVRDVDGSVAAPEDYELYINGNTYTGEVGVLNISLVVESLRYNTLTEATLPVTVVSGLTLNVSDYSVYRSDTATFDPMSRVEAYQTNPDGSTTRLGQYNGATDTGVSVVGTVDISTIGEYPLTYSAKNSMGIVEVKTVTVSVVSEEGFPTVTAADQEVEVGTSLTDDIITSWATASDPVDGDNLPVEYTVAEGTIDTSRVGTYNITYSYTNSAGNTAEASIRLEVVQRAVVDNPDANNNTQTDTTKKTTTAAGKTANSAKTGDTSNAVMLMLVLVLSALAIAGVVYFSRKRRRSEA